jgi:hypothetical protein
LTTSTVANDWVSLLAGLPPVVTGPQLARLLGVKPDTLKFWVEKGLLPPPLGLTRRRRWSREALKNFFASRPGGPTHAA